MQVDDIIVTKTYLPHPREQIVARPALLTRLAAGLSRRLILVCAPAGFGKTTLLSVWLDCLIRTEPGCHAAWLSLDAGDNDPYRFWIYTAAALRAALPEGSFHAVRLLEALTARLFSPAPPPLEALPPALINALSTLDGQVVLVLDDYHTIRAEAIHAGLNDLLDHLPPNARAVIATREDPPLRLALRRARGELCELRAADLRFSPAETGELLNTCQGLDLLPADVDALSRRTEGWVVGLHLAALSLKERSPAERRAFVRSFAGDDQFIFDYLMDEVFGRLSAREQVFLLRTSPLERLCGPLCQLLTGFADAADLLLILERANLFTQPLDNRRQWYRYHPLFADLLLRRLAETAGAEAVRGLRQQASAWHEQQGLLSEAVAYAQTAADHEYTARLLERHILDVFYHSEIHLAHQWLQSLPEDVLRRHPLLGAVYANTISLIQRTPAAFAQSQERLDAAEAVLRQSDPASVPFETEAYIAKFRAYLARFQSEPPAEVIRLARMALERIPPGSRRFRSALWFLLGGATLEQGDEVAARRAFGDAQRFGEESGDWFNATAAVEVQIWLDITQGRLRAALTACRATLEKLTGVSETPYSVSNLPPLTAPTAHAVAPTAPVAPLPIAGTMYARLGSLLVECNRLDEAGQMLERAFDLLAMTVLPDSQVTAWLALARLQSARGDVPGALAALQSAEALFATVHGRVVVHKARIWLLLAGQDAQIAAAAAHWAASLRLNAQSSDMEEVEQILLARWLVFNPTTRHPSQDNLLPFLEQKLAAALRRGQGGPAFELRALLALAYDNSGRSDRALDELESLLTIAEPEGYTRLFVEAGPRMQRLLQNSIARAIVPAACARLLAAFGADTVAPQPAANPQPGSQPAGALAEPLTAREGEVLALLAEGLTNRQIAARLHLSPNTVRIHTTHIYGKLGVTSRTQAAARARDLGLVLVHP